MLVSITKDYTYRIRFLMASASLAIMAERRAPEDAAPTCSDISCPSFYRVHTSLISTPSGQAWESHWHQNFHEVLWGSRGVLTVETARGVFMVPPGLGLLVPAGEEHAVLAGPRAEFRCTFFHTQLGAAPGDGPGAIAMPTVLQELLLHFERNDADLSLRRDSESVAFRMLRPRDLRVMGIVLPQDDRLRTVARGILDDPAEDCTLELWGFRVGASPRNLSRLFIRETDMTFAQWRLQARLRIALGLLLEGLPVGRVARRVGYLSVSAFVAAFRKEMGQTPGAVQGELLEA